MLNHDLGAMKQIGNYARDGIVYRAQEEYQQVLLIEPLNEGIRRKVEKLNNPQQK